MSLYQMLNWRKHRNSVKGIYVENNHLLIGKIFFLVIDSLGIYQKIWFVYFKVSSPPAGNIERVS